MREKDPMSFFYMLLSNWLALFVEPVLVSSMSIYGFSFKAKVVYLYVEPQI